MGEVVTQRILDELSLVKTKVFEMDKELHTLREDFEDTHLSEAERGIMARALEDERAGKTVSGEELRKRLGC